MKNTNDIYDRAKTAAGQIPQPPAEKVNSQPASNPISDFLQNPLAALVDLTISPELQNSFNQLKVAQLNAGFNEFIGKASQQKRRNEQAMRETEENFRRMVEEEKAKLSGEKEEDLRALAQKIAEEELSFCGMGKQIQSYVFQQTQTHQMNGNLFSSTTVVAALNGSRNGSNSNGFGK